jgi:RNA polymerase sigma-70 factor, ECF subfamily
MRLPRFAEETERDGPESQLSRFERLALPHIDAAFNMAFWIVRNQVEADDIVQESYLRAFHGFAGQNFKPWLLARWS